MSSYSITAVKINNFFKKRFLHHLSRLLRSLKILIAKVRRNERKFFPATPTYLKTSKILKILKKMFKLLKIPKILKILKILKFPKCPTINVTLIFFSFVRPHMSQPLWYSGLRPVPLPPAQPNPCPTRD